MIDRNIVLMHYLAMLIPKENSKRAEVLRTVIEYGGISVAEIEMLFGKLGFSKPSKMKASLQDLLINGCVKLVDGVYYPLEQAKPKALQKNVAGPKEPLSFKPLKTFLPKVAPRGQAIEERSFKTCTSNVKDPLFRNEGVPKL